MSIYRSGLFAGKVAIVTGGSTGIGKAITTELLHLGCKVAIASRNFDRLSHVAKSLSQIGDVQPFELNIRKEDEVKSAIGKIIDKYGRIDILVNNGGGQFPSLTKDLTLKGWNAVLETNLTGTFLMAKEVYNQDMKYHGGVITNIITLMDRGFPLMGHMSAARAGGVQNLTRTMAIEWISSGVRINCVAPGSIYSQNARENYGKFDIFDVAQEKGIPAKRHGSPDEIASAVCYLSSPAAAYITGTTLTIDGGYSLYASPMTNVEDHKSILPYEWTGKLNFQPE